MNTVLSLIIMLSQNTLKNDSTRIISQYLIDHIKEIKELTITKLAKECFTSTTTIIKYYEMLGFNSFTSFKKNLLSGMQTRKIQLIEKYDDIDIEQYFNRIQDISIDEINKEQFLKSIDRIVDYIHESQKIQFYGAIFPLALTLSFIEDMAIMGVSTKLNQVGYGNINFDEDGIHVIVTLSGRFMKFHKNIYKELCKKDNKTVLISQNIPDHNHLLMNILVPKTLNYDHNEVVLLMILDMIKLKYYIKYH